MDSDMLDMLDGDTATIPETQPAEIPKIDTMPDIAEILEAEEEEFLRERKKEPETAEIPELEPAPEPETAEIPELEPAPEPETAEIPEPEPQAVGEVRDILETCIILLLTAVSMKYDINERLNFVENFAEQNKKQIDKIIKKVERVLRKHAKLYNKLSKSNDYTFIIDVLVLVLTFDECIKEHIKTNEPEPETAEIPELEPAPEPETKKRRRFLK